MFQSFKVAISFCCVLFAIQACKTPDRYASPLKDVDISASDNHESSYYENDKAEISYVGFKVLYNPSTRQPDWVEYTLTAEQVRKTENTPKIPHNFTQDPKLSLPQATDDDYYGVNKKYGLSKGHMARHQDMKWSSQAVQESDYYTNICPQHEKLNTKLWKKIENLARRLATQYDSVHVICGPIFIDTAYGFIGPNRIPVPDYFFKTLLVKDANGYHSVAFICPNNDSQLTMEETARTVNEVEVLSQIDVYSFLPDEIETIVEDHIDMGLLNKW